MDTFVNDIYYYALESKARVIVLYGGRDSGKSYFAGGQYIPIAMSQEDYFRGVTVRKVGNTHKDSTYTEILDGVEALGIDDEFESIKSPLEITHCNGAKMIFRGLDEPKKMKSLKGLNFVWVEEAEDLTRKDYDDMLMLLRGEGYQRLVMSFNPVDETHFSNKDFAQAEKSRVFEWFDDGRPKVWEIDINEEIDGELVEYTVLCICSVYTDNAFISGHRKLTIEKLKEHDPELYEVYRNGKYGKTGGSILRNWEVKDFDKEQILFENFDNKGYSQDFGFNHANCILSAATYDNNLYIFDEIYVHEMSTADIIKIADEDEYSRSLRMVCDSADPGRIKTWQDNGYNAEGVFKYPGSVKDQIDHLKNYNKIYINAKCVNTLKEIKAWKWKQSRDGTYLDVPVDIFDDAMAALRYTKDLFSSRLIFG